MSVGLFLGLMLGLFVGVIISLVLLVVYLGNNISLFDGIFDFNGDIGFGKGK